MVRICDPQGRAVSPKDLTPERYNFLVEQHSRNTTGRNLHLDMANLLKRYHPKSKTQNPQGRPLDLSNHWALPKLMMEHLSSWTNTPATELFASPLNCLPDPQRTYYSAYQEDAIFGARHDSFSVSWRGHCVGNPEYEHEDMLNAMQHAIDSAESSPQPFTCILVLPRWKDTPYRRQNILLHPSVKIVTGIEAKHLKYVPADKEMASPPDPNQKTAHWAGDIILVSNEAGYNTIDWPRVKKELPLTLRKCADSPDFYVTWFPHPADLVCLKPNKPNIKTTPQQDKKHSTHTHLLQAADSPTPPPLDPAPFHEHHTWPACPNLRQLPEFKINKQTPLTVIELCGGIGNGLEALLQAGYTVSSYTWADINPDGHTVLQHSIPTLHEQYETQFPLSATQGWDTRLPFDINLITRDTLIQKFPNGAHIIIAGPPCQPYSIAGKGKGLTDKRSSALLAVARTITHLSRHHNRGVGYIIENVPGVKDFQEVLDTLGDPVLTDAPPCGSLAKRATLFWTNLRSVQELQDEFNKIQDTPIRSLRNFLKQNGFTDWDVPYLVGHSRAPKHDKYNTIGKKLAILPKFVCHPNARAYRRRGGYGRLLYKSSTAIPCIQIKEMVMGFQRDRTKAGGLADQHRHYLMGQCIDLNLLTWFLSSCESQPDETTCSPRPTNDSPQSLPQHSPQTKLNHPRAINSPPKHATTLPLWEQAHDPHSFIYTDGSKKDGTPVLGTAVFNAKTEEITYIDSTGSAECNTVVRAELIGIQHALQENQREPHVHILTDSLTALQKILLLHSQPLNSTRDHHHHVLQLISNLIEQRSRNGLSTNISKVSAHTGVWGNEIADKAAKAVVTAVMEHRTGEGVPYPDWVTPTEVPVQPHRPAYVLTDDPPPNQDGTQPTPRVFTTKADLHKHIKPQLRLHTAPPSTYHSIMEKARRNSDPTDFTYIAKHIRALIATGSRHQAKRLLAFVWGTMYTQKHAFWFGYAKDQICPVCDIDTDSCTHVGSGCRHPHLKSLYMDRHSAAVRLIRSFINNSPVGASLTLICEDSGRKPLPEDLFNPDNVLQMQQELLKTIPQPPEIRNPPPWHSPLDHRLEDVTLELKEHERAASTTPTPQTHESPKQHTGKNIDNCTIHQTIPEWVLSADAQQRLLSAGHGFKPDLLFIKGAPSPHPAVVTEDNYTQWKVTVIEVGFCADLRLTAKQAEKTDKYTPLIKELEQRWTHVHFIAVPIGNAGAMLASTKLQLANLVSTQPQRQLEVRKSEQLARTLTTMAARRLYGITVEYYRLRKEGAERARQKEEPAAGVYRKQQQGASATEPTRRPLKRHRQSDWGNPPVQPGPAPAQPVPSANKKPVTQMRANLWTKTTRPQRDKNSGRRTSRAPRKSSPTGSRYRKHPASNNPPRSTIRQPCPQHEYRALDRKPG